MYQIMIGYIVSFNSNQLTKTSQKIYLKNDVGGRHGVKRSIKVRIQKQTVKIHDNANYMSTIFRTFVIHVIPFFGLCKTVFWILNLKKK